MLNTPKSNLRAESGDLDSFSRYFCFARQENEIGTTARVVINRVSRIMLLLRLIPFTAFIAASLFGRFLGS